MYKALSTFKHLLIKDFSSIVFKGLLWLSQGDLNMLCLHSTETRMNFVKNKCISSSLAPYTSPRSQQVHSQLDWKTTREAHICLENPHKIELCYEISLLPAKTPLAFKLIALKQTKETRLEENFRRSSCLSSKQSVNKLNILSILVLLSIEL